MYILVFKRLLDIFLSFSLIIFLSPLLLIISIAILLFDFGPIIYFSDRVGKNNQIFRMPKFRTMSTEAPEVATHILDNPRDYISKLGGILRMTSLDEVPQLFSILMGSMSFVGPRPALFNQDDLITLRSQYGVDKLVPGLTGWAQINGRDEISIFIKVHYDEYYLQKQSFWFDLKILCITFFQVVRRSGVSH